MRSTRRNRKNVPSLSSSRRILGLNKKCPPGQILRAPYKRRFSISTKQSGYNVTKKGKTYRVYPKAGSTLVKASCIKNRGLAGKGPRAGTKGIGTLRKGELSRYGYNARLGEDQRHLALMKAIQAKGALTVYRMLDAVAKYTVRTAPEAHRIFVADQKWLESNYTLKKRT